ncbi:MAG: HDIG domain-containing metalloprotein [Candidatus Thermoplasmatota archaeon]
MISVLRLGHRPMRDKRVTTHVALTARALGASKIYIAAKDATTERCVKEVVERFGGGFEIETGVNWRALIRSWEGCIVHLTMYGRRLDDVLPELPRDAHILVVVGAEKVPREVYVAAHFNIAIGNQPHSEVSALAVFLHRYTGCRIPPNPVDGETLILPNPRGKTVILGVEIPNRKAAIGLLEALGCDPNLIEHSIAVETLALKIAERCGADIALVSAGALLHDIGRSKTHAIDHGLAGAELARELGLPEHLSRIIERHVGAGLTASEAEALGLPKKDYLPQTLEEKIVAHADNLVGIPEEPKRRLTARDAADRLRSAGARKGAQRLMAMHRELSALCGRDIDEL